DVSMKFPDFMKSVYAFGQLLHRCPQAIRIERRTEHGLFRSSGERAAFCFSIYNPNRFGEISSRKICPLRLGYPHPSHIHSIGIGYLLSHILKEIYSFNKLHCEEPSIIVGEKFVERGKIFMNDIGQRAKFVFEPIKCRSAGQRGFKNFEGYENVSLI